jgi:hypothetical protein
MTRIANPRYVALKPLRVAAGGKERTLQPFEEVPEAENWGDGLDRAIRAGDVGMMLVPTEAELLAVLKRATKGSGNPG